MKMIFNYDANKTHFHNKGFALGLVLRVRFFGTRKWPIGIKVKCRALLSRTFLFCFVLFCFFLTRDYRDMTLIQEVEAYLPKLIQTCYLSSGRSIAHKCSRLLMMCAR